MTRTPRILFVCLGNICRSPTAESVFKQHATDQNFDVFIDSAGTGGWHTGEKPDRRTRLAGEKRGYSFKGQSARQVVPSDFENFDRLIAMDSRNLQTLKGRSHVRYHEKFSLFLDYASSYEGQDVPDPYYKGEEGFEIVLNLVELASEGLLQDLRDNKD